MVTQSQSARKVVDLKSKEAVRPHMKSSIEDAQWVLTQSDPVKHLWIECQIAERFGGRDWRKLESTLPLSTFNRAKAVLEAAGLFQFKPITSYSARGRLVVTGWLVHNLHGYYNKAYWEMTSLATERPRSLQSDLARYRATSLATERPRSLQSEVEPETQSEQASQIRQPRINHPSTPLQGVEGGVSIPSEKTEAPQGGVLPTEDGMLEEESPTATETAIASDAIEETSLESSPSLTDQIEGTDEEPSDPPGDNSSAAAPDAAKMPSSIDEIGKLTRLKVEASIAGQRRVREEVLKRGKRNVNRHELEHLEQVAKYEFYQQSGHPLLVAEAVQWAAGANE